MLNAVGEYRVALKKTYVNQDIHRLGQVATIHYITQIYCVIIRVVNPRSNGLAISGTHGFTFCYTPSCPPPPPPTISQCPFVSSLCFNFLQLFFLSPHFFSYFHFCSFTNRFRDPIGSGAVRGMEILLFLFLSLQFYFSSPRGFPTHRCKFVELL